MEDSSLSASELKKRYHRGGSAADDELSAAQLRARHAIPSNQKDFSTKNKMKASQANMAVIIGIISVLLILALIVYYFQK